MLRLRRRRKPKPGLAAKTEVRSGLRRPSQRLLPILAAICLAAAIPQSQAFNKDNIEECSKVLSENLNELFERAAFAKEVPKFYEPYVEVEQFDPRAELRRSKKIIEKYLAVRSKYAYQAKKSFESREVRNMTEDDVNNPEGKDFVRFMSAKAGTDATTIYYHDHSLRRIYVNATRTFNLSANANFYSLPTSPIASAVHIPTPLYDRNTELLKKIEWSDIDQVYRTNREQTRDLAFQMFCSESGFMRYYPAASWYWDNAEEQLDLFDCRNTEWYINGATCSKNVIIMLDLSGSMLGQRYEIAKQTTEAILETLSHNDYFNIMAFSKNHEFLDDCNGNAGLLQGTMRNKKMLREKLDNLTSEGKAEYEKALSHAFSTLQGLRHFHVEWTTRDDLLMNPRNFTEGQKLRQMSENVLILPRGYTEAIGNYSRNVDLQKQGCESVIMLITDGAPGEYREIFDLYNSEKKVRFFSFLIGEEAIDFEQVREMACSNRGYMVHVANMADVEEKVQHYIRVMSRPIGVHADEIGEEDAVWSGVYRERLYLPRPEKYSEGNLMNVSFAVMNLIAAKKKVRVRKQEARGRMFVTTVSYPVVVNKTFMGVAAVNTPLTEISQHAHPSMVRLVIAGNQSI